MNNKKVIAVTGASRGIGASIATELASRGFLVACLSRKGLGVEQDHGSSENLVPYACDITDEASVRRVLGEIAEQYGPISGLVNNAGIHLDGKSEAFSSADFSTVLETNSTAVFGTCREAYPYLKQNGDSLIVNIGSFYDKLGVPWNAAYCASKAAVAAITRCLAVEWAKSGIRVLDVAPGFIETDLNREMLQQDGMQSYLKRRIPSGEVGKPEEVANVVASLFEENTAFLNGETIYLDGGHGMAH